MKDQPLLWSGESMAQSSSNDANITSDKDDTRTRIKSAARKLIAERGVEAVSTRDIMKEVEARNSSLLNYYFGSKENLISELMADIFKYAAQRWEARLQALEARGGPRTVRDVVEVIVQEAEWGTDSDSSPTVTRFLMNVFCTRRKSVRRLADSVDMSSFNYLLQMITQLLPDIPEHTMRQRLVFFAWYQLATLSAYEAFLADPNEQGSVWIKDDARRNIVDTSVGLLMAPVSSE